MPAPRFRSRSYKRIKRTTPGGKSVVHYRRKKVKKACCCNCGSPLPGVASYRRGKMDKLSKTKKRPERPFGGNLCSKCTREKIKERIR